MFLLLSVILGILLQQTSGASYTCNRKESTCGCSHRPVITAKITGGELATSHSWSWLVSLRFRDKHFCGGTILNEWFIITAAHCFVEIESAVSKVTVCAGIDYLSDICSQNFTLANITYHHEFQYRMMLNDIALLRLSTPLNFTDPFIARICLPDAMHSFDYPETGTSVIIAGWGSTEMNGTATNELQQATLKVIGNSARMCASNILNSRQQVCAYAPEKGMNS